MSAAASVSSVDAIVAAAHELKLMRLAGSTAEQPTREAGKTTGKKTVRCKLRLSKAESRALDKLRKQLSRHGIDAGTDELVRAGLRLLVYLDRSDLKAAIRDVIAPEPATPAE